jgi:hypothetical protein
MHCKSCRAYYPMEGTEQGTCRLIPPQVMFAGFMPGRPGGLAGVPSQPQPMILSAQPTVKAGDRCEQWAAVPVPMGEPVQLSPDAVKSMQDALDKLPNFRDNSKPVVDEVNNG